MAVIEALGLEVKILIGGEPVPEYPDAEENLEGMRLNRATKHEHRYIEVREGEFQISMKVLDNHPASEWIKRDRNLISFAPGFDGGESLSGIRVSLVESERIRSGVTNFENGTCQNFRFEEISRCEFKSSTVHSISLIAVPVCNAIQARDTNKACSGFVE